MTSRASSTSQSGRAAMGSVVAHSMARAEATSMFRAIPRTTRSRSVTTARRWSSSMIGSIPTFASRIVFTASTNDADGGIVRCPPAPSCDRADEAGHFFLYAESAFRRFRAVAAAVAEARAA